ncbi:unnamed protein product [Rhizoctonia solani]|uniref:RNA polymerase II-associated protein 3 n=1 Tax=Rhizoctonia solani TaxID=456999 RepID=A0A8H2XQR9_9AGAM|nr:unnamed protein product [Rhizoctonia solani]
MATAEYKEKARECRVQGRNEDAERDCTTVLKLQANNVKALFRRAQARVGLGKLPEARADLVAAAKAEPGNAAVRTEFTKVEGLMAEAAKKAKAGKGTPISLPTRAPAPPEPSGPPYRRRVPITIVNDDAPEEDAKGEAPEPKATQAGAAAPPKSILKNASPALSNQQPASQPVVLPVAPKSDSFLTPISTRSLSYSEAFSENITVPVSSSSTAALIQPPSTASVEPTAHPASATSNALEPTVTALAPNKGTEEPSPTFPLEPNLAPPTLLEFLQKWSNTRTNADRASIIFSVPPSSIPSLFGPTLESPLLSAMLSALLWALASAPNLPAADIPQRTLAYMTALAQVPRFSTLVLFLDAAEKKIAKEVWDGLEQSGVDLDLGKEKQKWGC